MGWNSIWVSIIMPSPRITLFSLGWYPLPQCLAYLRECRGFLYKEVSCNVGGQKYGRGRQGVRAGQNLEGKIKEISCKNVWGKSFKSKHRCFFFCMWLENSDPFAMKSGSVRNKKNWKSGYTQKKKVDSTIWGRISEYWHNVTPLCLICVVLQIMTVAEFFLSFSTN